MLLIAGKSAQAATYTGRFVLRPSRAEVVALGKETSLAFGEKKHVKGNLEIRQS
jgi:hypothetical protein